MRLKFSKERIDEFVEALQGKREASFANLSLSDVLALGVACQKAFEQSIKLPADFEGMTAKQQARMLGQRSNVASAATGMFKNAYDELEGTYMMKNSNVGKMVDGRSDLILNPSATGVSCSIDWEYPEGVANER